MTMGMRNMYSKKEIKSVDDIKGQKVRVQATKTEDTHFPAYGAQTVHMPFGEVYTSLQTGVVNVAENGVNVYLANKHYEVAPVLSLTEHEANNNCIWVSDKTWNSLTDEEKKWVQAAAEEVAKTEPAKALAAREGVGRAAEEARRQGRRGRRQVRLHQGGAADPGPARQGARAARGEDPRARAQREVSRPAPAAATAPPRRHPSFQLHVRPALLSTPFVIPRERHLKWPALDWLEALLLPACGACIIGFSLSVLLRRRHPRDRPAVAVAAAGDDRLLRLGRLHRHGARGAAQRPHVPGRDRAQR